MKGNFGIRLRQWREDLGWKKCHLAERAGLSPATITRVEAGKVRPGPRTIRDLAVVLGKDIGELKAILAGEESTGIHPRLIAVLLLWSDKKQMALAEALERPNFLGAVGCLA